VERFGFTIRFAGCSNFNQFMWFVQILCKYRCVAPCAGGAIPCNAGVKAAFCGRGLALMPPDEALPKEGKLT